jgi:hypothetical protein
VRLADDFCRFFAECLDGLEIRWAFIAPTPVFPRYFISEVNVVDSDKQLSEAIDVLYLIGTLVRNLA